MRRTSCLSKHWAANHLRAVGWKADEAGSVQDAGCRTGLMAVGRIAVEEAVVARSGELLFRSSVPRAWAGVEAGSRG